MRNIKSLIIIPLLFFFINCDAKIMGNWGKLYDVTYNESTKKIIPAYPNPVHTYLNDYFKSVIEDMKKHTSKNGCYTILFPKRNYIVNNQVTFDLSAFPELQGMTINMIGLNTDYGNKSLGNSIKLRKEKTIMNPINLAKTYMVVNKPINEKFLDYKKMPMPKFIYKPLRDNHEVKLPNSNIFQIQNSVLKSSSGTYSISNNSFNMMGFEIEGEAAGAWSTLKPHPYFNTATGWGVVNTLYWKNLFIDNNFLHDHYGNGISIYTCHLGILPNLGPYQNEVVEVKNNVVLNIYAFTPQKLASGAHDESGDGILVWGTKHGKFTRNLIYNDLNITGMCGRLGLGGETYKDCLFEENQINGYNRDFHAEKDGGNNTFRLNRCTGTICAILLSDWSNSSTIPNPNIITQNYFSTENIPVNKEKWNRVSEPDFYIWDGAYWSYSLGLIYFYRPGGLNKGILIDKNTFFIDKNSGSLSAQLAQRFIYSDCLDMDISNNNFTTNCTSCEFGMYVSNLVKKFDHNNFNNASGALIINFGSNHSKAFGNNFTGKVGTINWGSTTPQSME